MPIGSFAPESVAPLFGQRLEPSKYCPCVAKGLLPQVFHVVVGSLAPPRSPYAWLEYFPSKYCSCLHGALVLQVFPIPGVRSTRESVLHVWVEPCSSKYLSSPAAPLVLQVYAMLGWGIAPSNIPHASPEARSPSKSSSYWVGTLLLAIFTRVLSSLAPPFSIFGCNFATARVS